MKKIFVFLLICFTAATAFAEFSWIMTMDVKTNMYGIIIPTGEHSNPYRVDFVTGDLVPNNGVPDGYGLLPRKTSLLFLPLDSPDLLNGSYIPISQSYFRSTIIPGGWSWLEGNGMDITMLWNGNNISSSVLFSGGRMMNYLMYATHPDTKSTFNLQNLLQSFMINEYWIRADTQLFTAHFGNRGGGAKTDDFQDHSGWMPTPMRIDGFGVNLPSPEGPINVMEGHRNLHNIGAKDFIFGIRRDSWMTFDVSSYFIGTIKMDRIIPDLPFPLFIDLGFDFDPGVIGNKNDSNMVLVDTDGTITPVKFGMTQIGGGVRISGDMAFNMVTFDLAYKIRGGDPTSKINDTWDVELEDGNFQPDGYGSLSHVFGLYFTLPRLVPDLGIGFGYTGLFRTYEKEIIGYHNEADEDLHRTIKADGPFFSGVDLFLRYTGIQDLRITLKNNVSFASVAAPVYDFDDNIITVKVGMDGYNLAQFNSQSWFAMYNSLVLRYLISGRLQFFFEGVSHLGILTDINRDEDRRGEIAELAGLDSWGTRKRIKHTMSGALYASHQFSSYILLEGGISVFSENAKTRLSGFPEGELGEFAPTSFSAGGIGIAIPIKLKLSW